MKSFEKTLSVIIYNKHPYMKFLDVVSQFKPKQRDLFFEYLRKAFKDRVVDDISDEIYDNVGISFTDFEAVMAEARGEDPSHAANLQHGGELAMISKVLGEEGSFENISIKEKLDDKPLKAGQKMMLLHETGILDDLLKSNDGNQRKVSRFLSKVMDLNEGTIKGIIRGIKNHDDKNDPYNNASNKNWLLNTLAQLGITGK